MSEKEKTPLIRDIEALLKKYKVSSSVVHLYTLDAETDKVMTHTQISGNPVELKRTLEQVFKQHPNYFELVAEVVMKRAMDEMGMLDEASAAKEGVNALKSVWNNQTKGEA